MTPAIGPATLCAVFVETDDRTGLAVRCEPVRIGGRLIPTAPVRVSSFTEALAGT